MDTRSDPMSLGLFQERANDGYFDFNDPLQRSEGQWNKKQKSELIESILKGYPFGAVYVIKEQRDKLCEPRVASEEYLQRLSDELNQEVNETYKPEILIIVDGVQRLSTIIDYMNGLFALDKNIKPIRGMEVAGLKYNELPIRLQNYFTNRQIEMSIMSECSDSDKREIFRRINGGKPLTKSQKNTAIISYDLATKLQDILIRPSKDGFDGFWKKVLSKSLIKNGQDKDMVLEAMMLLDMDEDSLNFENESIQKFITYLEKDMSAKDKKDLFERLEKASDVLADVLGDDAHYINKLTIPVLVAGYCKVIKNKKKEEKEAYLENVKAFVEYAKLSKKYSFRKTDTSEVAQKKQEILRLLEVEPRYELARNYVQFNNTSGTASHDKVVGRWHVFKDMLKSIPADVPGEIEEIFDKQEAEKAEKATPKKRGRKPKVTQEAAASTSGEEQEMVEKQENSDDSQEQSSDVSQDIFENNEGESETGEVQEEGGVGGAEQ